MLLTQAQYQEQGRSRHIKVCFQALQFWISFGCPFHLSCLHQKVEVQTEKDVAHFIAMSPKAVKDCQKSERADTDYEDSVAGRKKGLFGQARKPRKPLCTFHCTNWVENYCNQNTA